MGSVFNCAINFNQDISSWDVEGRSVDTRSIFDNCPIAGTEKTLKF